MNKKIIIILISIFSVILICGTIFAFQKNGQVEQNKNLLDEFGDSGFKSVQNSKDNKQENLMDYGAQAVLVESEKQEFNLTQTLEFLAKTGKDLFGMKRERVFQPVNKIF